MDFRKTGQAFHAGPGYHQQPPQPQAHGAPVFVAHQMGNQRMFGPDPMTCVCPNCHNNITTTTTEEIGVMAWIAAAVLCAFVCWPCAPIPLCMDSLKDVTHRCPSCHCIVGRYRAKM